MSRRLELPPTATYSALCLWNFCSVSLRADEVDFANLDSLRMGTTLTGTVDEEWFYRISVAVEAQGASSIGVMLRAIEAAAAHEYSIVIDSLNELASCIIHLGTVLERMYERCRPTVFYHHIRPLLAGSKNMAAAGLPRGVFYDEGSGKGKWIQLRGGSNAQSSLIQFFDAVLGVVHESLGKSPQQLAEANHHEKTVPFHEEMRLYMPGPHRRLLEAVSAAANIREFALRDSSHPDQARVRNAYHIALNALSNFRGIHLQIVAKYIVIPSKQAHYNGKTNLAPACLVASGEASRTGLNLIGTGGTALIPFLKQTREETERAGHLE